jgi:hypothetical protein
METRDDARYHASLAELLHGPGDKAFGDISAAIANLDRIAASDSMISHLAGALGWLSSRYGRFRTGAGCSAAMIVPGTRGRGCSVRQRTATGNRSSRRSPRRRAKPSRGRNDVGATR